MSSHRTPNRRRKAALSRRTPNAAEICRISLFSNKVLLIEKTGHLSKKQAAGRKDCSILQYYRHNEDVSPRLFLLYNLYLKNDFNDWASGIS
ncbi:MAG TPA: hypothetical protein PL157_14165 [Acidobacteriota bacterium]|nr:hypothetical protein [Acidobacteriota bacterium]